MGRETLHRTRNIGAEHLEKLRKFLVAHFLRHRMKSLRQDALAEHHLDPAVLDEELVVLAEHPPGFAEQFHLLGKAIGNVHRCALTPERAVAPVGGFVMQDQEVADLYHIGKLLIIEFGDVALTHLAGRHHAQEADHCTLNQVDARRFQRFEET